MWTILGFSKTYLSPLLSWSRGTTDHRRISTRNTEAVEFRADSLDLFIEVGIEDLPFSCSVNCNSGSLEDRYPVIQ